VSRNCTDVVVSSFFTCDKFRCTRSPGFNGLVGAAISLPGIIPAKPSVSFVTPNAWNDIPSFTTSNTILSPTLISIVGLTPGSSLSALNVKDLKSADSRNERFCVIVIPVASAGPE